MSLGRGVLHLVVGASGAGKDTLMAEAAKARPDLLVAERVITRPSDAGGEVHRGVDEAEFDRLERAGAFALSWRAHGLGYGVPIAAVEALDIPRHALVNVSRSVVAEARRRYGPLRVLLVSATPEARAARLAGRGRESAEDVAERLRRAAGPQPEGEDVRIVDNSGALEDGVARFLAALAPPLS